MSKLPDDNYIGGSNFVDPSPSRSKQDSEIWITKDLPNLTKHASDPVDPDTNYPTFPDSSNSLKSSNSSIDQDKELIEIQNIYIDDVPIKNLGIPANVLKALAAHTKQALKYELVKINAHIGGYHDSCKRYVEGRIKDLEQQLDKGE